MNETFIFAYFGMRFVLAAVAIWLGMHWWITRQPDTNNHWMTPVMVRYPWVISAIGATLAGIMIFALEHLKPEYAEPYENLLAFGAPVLGSWYVFAVVATCAIVSTGFYHFRKTKTGGSISFVGIMLAMMTLPYHAPF